MKALLRDVAREIVTATRYPSPVRFLLNRSPAPVHVEVGDSTEIERRCVLHGDITLDDDVTVARGSVLSGEVTVGEGTNLVRQNELIGDVTIGKYCAIGPYTNFQEPNHITSRPSLQFKFYRDVLETELGHVSKGPIRVGNDVWFGTRVTVLSGVSVGHGAVVGAGSVVTRDVEPYSIVVGNPARRVGWRFSEPVREKLLKLEWWDWSREQMRRQKSFFEADIHDVESLEGGSRWKTTYTSTRGR